MSTSGIVVAIAGSTGLLGIPVSRIFLESGFKNSFSNVICFTRDPKSAKALELASIGADIRQTPPDDLTGNELRQVLKEHLRGVHVLINALSTPAGELKEALVDVAVEVGVKVYFPSEFGTDYRNNKFGDWENSEWRGKQLHAHRARELAKGSMKIICLYTGVFQEFTLLPLIGRDVTNRKFTLIGSPDVRTTYTRLEDIGRAVTQLSILSMSNAAALVPDHVHIAGDTKSTDEIKALCEKKIGGTIQYESVDLAAFREEVKERYVSGKRTDLIGHLQIVMAEGLMDQSKDNDNDLINPGETLWRWKTLGEFIEQNVSA